MKSKAVTLKQITQVELTAELNIFDLVDTDNFYLRLKERRNIVTSLLNGHGVKKGDAVYNSILNNFNYQWIIELIDSNFHDLSQVIELTEFTPLQLSKTDEEFQKILTGIFYLAIDDLLMDHLTTYIKDNNKILETNCLATAGCLAQMEKLGLALGFPKVSENIFRKRQGEIAKRKIGKVGPLKHAIQILKPDNLDNLLDILKNSESIEDLFYSNNDERIDIHDFEIYEDDKYITYRNRKLKLKKAKFKTLKNYISGM